MIKNIVSAFESQVNKTPKKIAIEFRNRLVSYEELNIKANTLANYLINEKGIKNGDIVPLLLDRDENIIVAMLAVLKTGAAYTALSKQYPQSRINFVLEQTNAKLIIDDMFMSQKFKQYKFNPNSVISSKDKAYIVYTSGTTGNPKGVVHTQESVFNHIEAYSDFLSLDKYSNLNMLFLVNYVFSVATTQIYSALFHGHKLTISEPDCLENLESFTKYISDNKINYFQSTPSIADSLDFSKINSLSLVAVAGEKLPISLVESANKNDVKLVNVYGQSEFHSTTAKIIQSTEDINNIGEKLKNMTIYILNENLQEVNIGEIGEICVAGDQLAEGYLNLVEETKTHFIDNPFGEGRLCKTGDLVKKLPNNEYEFIGRSDFQLNINGIRTEPAEIEVQINSVPGIKNSVVVGYKDQFIIAYYVSETEMDAELIKMVVNKRLPEYMHPHIYKWLDRLPLNDNGKLDRRKLPQVSIARKEMVAPANSNESLLIEMIEKVLDVSSVSILENFFELGGTSLQAISLSNLVMKRFNKRLTTKDILGANTIQDLASILNVQNIKYDKNFAKLSNKTLCEMSPAQKRMFVIYELDKNSTDYNEQTVLDFSERVDINLLYDCIKRLVSNHESLRTKFYNKQGEYVQEILSKGIVDFRIISEPHDFLSLIEPFDLEKGCTMHVRLIQGENKDVLFIDKHHIITDGTSEEIFYSELGQLYSGKSLEANKYQYKDYSTWINQLDLHEEKKWWFDYLNNYQRLEIISDFKYKKNTPVKGKTKKIHFDRNLLTQIRQYSKNNRVSDYIFILSSISILLSKMYNSKDFIVGTVSNGRLHEKTENMIGMFVNTLPIRINIDTQQSTKQFLNIMNENVMSVLVNQNYQFENIAKDLNATNEGTNPFFDCMVVYQNTKFDDYFDGKAIRNTHKTTAPKFKLTFEIEDSGNSMELFVNYDESLFRDTTIDRLCKNLLIIIENFINNPHEILSKMSVLSDKEKEKNLNFENTQKHASVIDLIEKEVGKHPEDIALKFDNITLTYSELDNEVNKLANHLIKNYRIQEEDKIPLVLNRSEKMIIAILAVLKTGAAYVPISPKYPNERIDYILSTCNSKLIIDDQFMKEKIPNDTSRPNILINENSLAYIIFTSGTTGNPKGVMVEHRNLSNFVSEIGKMPHSGMKPGNVNGAFFEYVFDASIHDLIRPFAMGESVVMLDTSLIYDIDKFIDVLKRYKVNSIGMTPSLAGKIDLSLVPTMKYIHCGGEAITQEVIEKYKNTNIQINNCYGPTETTILSFVNNDVSNATIGVPIGGVYPLVLDDDRQILPMGAVGNLFIGGNQVTRGYINQIEETNKRYITNPFGEGIIYDTGDLVRRLEDGSYEYFGRKDQQVKVRGFRVELPEVEKHLQEIDKIDRVAITIDRENLIAYFTSEEDVTTEDITRHLKKNLPEYMIPIAYMRIEDIPLTINGKTDIRKLPKMNYEEKYVAPITERENEITKSVCKVLGLSEVSVEADFFRIGGNSIAAIELSSLINVQVKDIFEQKTIRKLAKVHSKQLEVRKQLFDKDTDQVLSYAQERLFYIDQLEEGSQAYNVPIVVSLTPNVDIEKLEQSIKKVIRRHEILRTIINNDHQKVLNSDIEITHNQIEDSKYFAYRFDLTKEIPIKINIYLNKLSVNVHHIAFDGWSTNIFLNEVAAYYYEQDLPKLDIQYKDYAKWQRALQNEEFLKEQKSYWVDKLLGYETLDFPTDYSRPMEFDYKGQGLVYKLRPGLMSDLEDLAKNYKTSLFTVTLTAFMILLSTYSNQEDIVLGTPIANRHIKGTKDLIGFFVNTLALRSKINSDMSIGNLIRQNAKQITEAQEFQDIPFESVVKALGIESDLSRNPIFQIMFGFQDNTDLIDTGNIYQSVNDNLNLSSTKFDLSVMHRKDYIEFTYAISLFKKDTINGIAKTYENILSQMVTKSDELISDLVFKTDTIHESKKNYPNDTVHQLFEKVAACYPDNLAIVYDSKKLTYDQLNKEANKLAHTLLDTQSISHGTRIPILMERSEKYVVAILGILKAGACYIPLSVEYPQSRIDYILEKTNAPFIVDEDFLVSSQDTSNPNIEISNSSLAYIIFTSGTTGLPKGVMIEHKGVVNTIYNQIDLYNINSRTTAVHFADFVFDASVFELFYTLLAGATTYLLNQDTRKDFQLLKQVVDRNNIDMATLPPSILNSEDLLPLKILIVAGETTPKEIFESYRMNGTTMINAYGPTETTVCATVKFYKKEMDPRNIGKALANVITFVLDSHLRELPSNAIGELYVGGAGLARGYIGDIEKTNNSFLDHPKFGRIYKTGDIVKRMNSGDLLYIGRNDFQVKVRGFRIELGEIEARMIEQKSVKQCVAIAKNNSIIAYYTGELNETLDEILPSYMVPNQYIKLSEIPITINGKIDTQRLPEPKFEEREFITPHTKREVEIAEAFCELLKLEKVSINDDFYKLGGNSILALKLSNKIDLQVKQILQARNIKNMAKLVKRTPQLVSHTTDGESYSLSFAQERLWFIDQFEHKLKAYNIPIILELSPAISLDKIEAAIKEIVYRHEILRTLIIDGVQVIQSYGVKVTHEAIDAKDFIEKSFDLSKEIPIRVNIYNNKLMISIHHIAFDGWSTEILLNELNVLYKGTKLSPLQNQYKDYSSWQRENFNDQELSVQEKYWEQNLKDYEPLNLPSDLERPKEFSYNGKDINVEFKSEWQEALKQLAQKYEISLYTVMLSLLDVTLAQFSYQQDIIVGTPFANRHTKGTEGLIGFFINTLPIRTKIGSNVTFKDVFLQNNETIVNAQNNQDIPFEKIVKLLEVPQDTSRNPIFQVLFSVQDFAPDHLVNNEIFTGCNKYLELSYAKYDLSVIIENGVINFNYCTDIYNTYTIQSMINYYVELIKLVIVNEFQEVEKIQLNGAALVGDLTEYPTKTVVDLFEEQVAKTPNHIAVEYQNTKLTYYEFDKLTNQFGNYLLMNGVEPGDKIPIFLERSEKMAIAIWGTLKAGCSYVPISPDFPEERKNYIINQIESQIVVDQSFEGFSKGNQDPIKTKPQLDDLAYIIFTSGTTGNPKGVMIEHSGLINRVQWMNEYYPIEDTDKIYQKTNYVFDVSVWEQVWALLVGARIVFAMENGHKDPLYLSKEIQKKQITVMHFVPSMLDVFLDTLETYNEDMTNQLDVTSLKYVFCSGEALSVASVKRFNRLFPRTKLYNLYGPTEASIDVTAFDCNKPHLEKVLIGKPVPNTNCYVLNHKNQPVPEGAIGELALGGLQLAKGYVNQPDLTKERFISHPEIGRIYKTGDLVRILHSGEIEYLGRNDFQVKIHGLRIELSEIEERILEIRDIQQAAVLKIKDQLVAYYTGSKKLSIEKLKISLKEKLPDYMVPTSYIYIKEFPLTINGKLDRRELPDPQLNIEEYIKPENTTESCVQEIFSELLEREAKEISVLSDFFSMGGDSIKAIQLSNRIKQKLDKTVSIKQIFASKTIREISSVITEIKEVDILSEQGILTGEVSMLPVQKWFFEEYNSSYFNQAFAIKLPHDVDVNRLKISLIQLVNYHDALRLIFKNGIQEYADAVDEVELVYVQNVDEINELQSNIDLGRKSYRFAIRADENILIMIFHHLVIDSVSWQILTNDLKELYEGKKLPDKQTSYRQWSDIVHSLGQNVISNLDETKSVQKYKQGNNYQKVSIKIDTVLTAKLLNKVNQVYNTSVNDVLLTALARTLKSVHGSEWTPIKLESHGRGEIESNINIQRTVGWFTTIYPQLISTNLLETKTFSRKLEYGIEYGAKNGIHSYELPTVMFNYLGQVGSNETIEWSIVQTDLGKSTDVSFNEALTINGVIFNKVLNMEFSGYIENIDQISQLYKNELELLVTKLYETPRTYLTIEDVNQIISQDELNSLQNKEELELILPANALQKGFVYQSLANTTKDDAYICSFVFEYEQKINVEAYKKAWILAQEKYPSLRLSLNSDYDEILQVIFKKGTVDFEYIENKPVNEVVEFERNVPFNLSEGNLFRIRLVKIQDNHYACILTNHHAILDGWSNPVLINFVHDAYYSITENDSITIVEDKAYINSQRYLENTQNQNNEYWRTTLKEVSHPDLGGLFNEKMRSAKIENYNRIIQPKDQIFKLTRKDFSDLVEFSKKQSITVNIIIQYVWHKVLNVYGGINDTTVGVVNAGRNIPIEGIEESVGLFIRTLPVQFRHSGKSIISELEDLQDLNHENMIHNNVNLAELQSKGDRLFDTVFIYENYPIPKSDLDSARLKITKFDGIEKLDYPITIIVNEFANELNIRIKYAAELFDSCTIHRLFEFMKYLIKQITQNEETFKYVQTIPEFGQEIYPNNTIIELFEKQVKSVPESVALKFEDIEFTFDKLNRESNRVARTLVENYHINIGDRIPLLLHKSEKMIIAILGVLKAGGVYVPMSPTFPNERISYIQEQVGASLTIDDDFMDNKFSKDDSNLNLVINPENLAYIIFTSGTTGRPKGVMVEHRNFICYLRNILTAIRNTGAHDIEFGGIAEYVFDIFGTEVFGQLLRGKPVNLFAGNPEDFPEFMEKHRITTLQSTPGKISYLFQDNDQRILATNLNTILVGGEKMNDSFANRFRNTNLINIYGPTEGTVWTSMKKIESNYSNIGHPFPNYAHFILDDNMRLVPDGAIGELYVGGPQLSKGYYGQPELTKKAFLDNPYNYAGTVEYSRLYRTGDIVRRLLNKDFELIGRKDFQVKIRGFRIELGEIEAAMLRIPEVKQVLALALGDTDNKYLGVYYKSDIEIERAVIDGVISQYLTDYMMPSGYQYVKEFPLTINGKIDRRALPQITYDNHTKFIKPRNVIEKDVLAIVCEVLDLNIETTSVLESFFNIGGDSIKLIKLISIIESTFGYRVSIKQIFEAKTIEKIANLIKLKPNGKADEDNKLVVTKQMFLEEKDQKLSYVQYMYQYIRSNSYSNIKMRFKIKENVDEERLSRAVIAVVNRHEILRTKILEGFQIVDNEKLNVTSEKFDSQKYFDHVFDLKKEIPIKVNIYDQEFMCVIDHVAFDGWSTSLFLKEIEAFYNEENLQELPYQYKDFSRCQYDFLNSDKKLTQLSYWKNELADFEGIHLSQGNRQEGNTDAGADIYYYIEDAKYNKLQNYLKENGYTMHNVLLSIFYLMVYKESNQDHVAIVIPTLNRNIPGADKLIGLFVNQLLLQMKISKNETFKSFVDRLNEKVISTQNNQDIPFEQMLKENNLQLNGDILYFGIQGFKGEALKQSHLFESISEMNQQVQKEAFSDLTLFVWGQNLDFNYAKTLFKEEVIRDFVNTYSKILNLVIENPDIEVKEMFEEEI